MCNLAYGDDAILLIIPKDYYSIYTIESNV